MTPVVSSELTARLLALEEDNQRLRTALAECEARASASPHELLLRDALLVVEEPLVCEQAEVPGRVTVIVPAFNAAAFLTRAVESVWAQTYPAASIELLVVDDGSTDGTRVLAERLMARSPVTMRVLTHDGARNRGVAPTRKLAARVATGEFIALLDADDAYLPERLEVGIDTMRAHRDLVAVCSLGRNVDADGRTISGHNGTVRAGDWRTLPERVTPPFSFEDLWQVDPIANSTLTIRRRALEEAGGFPSLMAHQSEDWLLVLKLSLLAPIACIDRELILYTHHPGAYTSGYHVNGWREGARIEAFYQLTWWMLRHPRFADAGARFFRREYPRLIADHHRLLPLLREYYAVGGRPAEGARPLQEHVRLLSAELEALRRTTQLKLHENRRLRQIVAAAAREPELTASTGAA